MASFSTFLICVTILFVLLVNAILIAAIIHAVAAVFFPPGARMLEGIGHGLGLLWYLLAGLAIGGAWAAGKDVTGHHPRKYR